jgi:hypothetical protein
LTDCGRPGVDVADLHCADSLMSAQSSQQCLS